MPRGLGEGGPAGTRQRASPLNDKGPTGVPRERARNRDDVAAVGIVHGQAYLGAGRREGAPVQYLLAVRAPAGLHRMRFDIGRTSRGCPQSTSGLGPRRPGAGVLQRQVHPTP